MLEAIAHLTSLELANMQSASSRGMQRDRLKVSWAVKTAAIQTKPACAGFKIVYQDLRKMTLQTLRLGLWWATPTLHIKVLRKSYLFLVSPRRWTSFL